MVKKREIPPAPPVPPAGLPMEPQRLPPLPEEAYARPLPPRELPPIPRRVPPEHIPEVEVPEIPAGAKSPPVFVKLERYKEILQSVQKLKSYAMGLRDALEALEDIEAELKKALALTSRALDQFNSNITVLNRRISRVHGTEERVEALPSVAEATPPADIETSVQNLYEQMGKIKKALIYCFSRSVKTSAFERSGNKFFKKKILQNI